ncbi:MAG: hypothetical protein WC644_07175 [Ignavibacteria bacterium]
MSERNKTITGYIIITFVFLAFLMVSGILQTGFLSDDYVASNSANISTLKDKFTSNIKFHNSLLFRPLWSLTLCLDIVLTKFFELNAGNFIIPIIHNLILYLLFALIPSLILLYLTRDKYLSYLYFVLILLFPNNLHSLLWMVCRHDTQAGILGMLSMLSMLLYIDKEKRLYKYISAALFLLSLMFKEAGLVFAFLIVFMVFYLKDKNYSFKVKDYILHLAFLLVYSAYKLYLLGGSSDRLINYFSFSLSERLYVIPKALFSFFSFADYLSTDYFLNTLDIENLALALFPLLCFLSIFLIVYRRSLKGIFLFGLFLILIIPNIIAGYFSPRLVIIPFAAIFLFVFYDFKSLNYKKQIYVKIIVILVIMFFVPGAKSMIEDYKEAYKLLMNKNTIVTDELIKQEPKKIFLLLPSRIKQVHVYDNIPTVYNYYKYNDFVYEDDVDGFVNYAALDLESLKSEIKISKLNDTVFTAYCTGITQYFYNSLNNSVIDYENEYIKCEFIKDKMFLNKSKTVKITLKKSRSYDYIALTNKSIMHINSE